MAGNRRHDSPGSDADAGGFVARWSARKRASVVAGDTQAPPVSVPDARQPKIGEGQKGLTDQDMPPVESLDEESDYSGFLSPGVSDALQRLALRKLFSAARFQVRDGLDDYDSDYNLLLPLRRVLAGLTEDELAQHLQRTGQKLPARAGAAEDDTGQQRSPLAEDPAPQSGEPDQPDDSMAGHGR